MAKTINEYRRIDERTLRPRCFVDKNDLESKVIVQEVDKIEKKGKMKVKEYIEYFAPNNVGILLSKMNKSIRTAKTIYSKKINLMYNSKEIFDDLAILNTKIIYNYIEEIQTAIVFGYTALEAFSNLSIPEKYVYTAKPNSKGIVEAFDKMAIERWTQLKTKLSEILPEIYKTGDIKKEKLWNNFMKLEETRNSIIHQKTIEKTEFYNTYFSKEIFDILEVPETIIKYFYENNKAENKEVLTLWPWLINTNRDFYIEEIANPSDFMNEKELNDFLSKKRKK